MGRQWRLWVTAVLAAALASASALAWLRGQLGAPQGTVTLPLALLAAMGALLPLALAAAAFGLLRRQSHLAQRQARELEQVRTQLQVTLESSDEGVLIVDSASQVISINPRFVQLWRVPADLARSGQDQALLDFVLEQLVAPEKFISLVRQLYGSDAESRDTLLFKDGRVFSRYTRAIDVGGQRGRIWCFKDITEQQQAHADLAATLQAIPDLLFEVDGNGTYLQVWARRPELLAAPKEELLGRTVAQILPSEAATTVMQALRAAEFHGLSEGQVICLAAPDGPRWFELSTSRKAGVGAGANTFIIVSRNITERKLAEERLAAREREFRTLSENSPDHIARFDRSARLLYANPALERALGKRLHAIRGKTPMEVSTRPAIFEKFQKAILEVATSGKGQQLEQLLPLHGGAVQTHFIRLVAELDTDSVPCGVLAVGRDVTEIRAAAENLLITASVFDNSQEGILITDANNRIIKVNEAFTRITGYRSEEVLQRNPRILRSGRQDQAFYAALWQSLEEKRSWRGEIWNRRKSGEIYPELLSISVICDAHGDVQRYVGVFSDITTVKAHEAELRRIAQFDALTGIPNRLLLADRLGQSIIRAQRAARLLAVCFLDLDGFKHVNDQHGHEAGDQMLVELTQRLLRIVRAGDTVARMGGDEFVILFNELARPEECFPVLDRILQSLAQPVPLPAQEVAISASIGVSFHPVDGVDADTLLRNADHAMYLAKQMGKNRYHCYAGNRSSRGNTLRTAQESRNDGAQEEKREQQ